MELILFASKSCYPCERAQSELFRSGLSYLTHYSGSKEFIEYNVINTPVLVFLNEDGDEVARLSGAHNIRKMEIEGIIKDNNLVAK